MAFLLLNMAMLEGEQIQIFSKSQMLHDFTYVDDIFESLTRLLDKPAVSDFLFDHGQPDPSTSWAPHRMFIIGNSKPTLLMDYIEAFETSPSHLSHQRFPADSAGRCTSYCSRHLST